MNILVKWLISPLVLLTISLSSWSAFAGTPTFTMAFSPTTIGPGSTTTLIYTISSTGSPASDISFTNTLPAGVTIAGSAHASTDCPGGIFTAPDGGGVVTMSNYRLGTGESCTMVVDITSSTGGSHVNTTGDLTSSEGNSGTANATLTVDTARPGFSLAFSSNPTTPGTPVTMTYTVDNTLNGGDALLLTFTHILPDGLIVSGDPNASSTCNQTFTPSITAPAGASSIVLQLGGVAAGSTCTVQVNVISQQAKEYYTETGQLSQNGANPGGKATARLTVARPFLYTNFPAVAPPGSSVTMSFTMTNSERSDATDISFTDDLEAVVSGLAASSLPAAGFCGPGSTISGSSTLAVNGASLASGESCSFDVTVDIPINTAAGTYSNTTSPVSLSLVGATTKPAAASNLVVKPIPQLSMSFTDDPVNVGGDVTLRFSVTNTDSANSATGLNFSVPINDIYGGMVVKTLPPANSCGTDSSFSQQNSSGALSFSAANGSLAAGANCTFEVILTVAGSGPSGEYQFSSNNISGIIAGKTLYGNSAGDTLMIEAAPRLSLAIVEDAAAPSGTATAQFTLDYGVNAPADATSVGFAVDLNSALPGLTSITGDQSNVCGTGSSLSGTSTLTLSDASLSPGASCTFSVTLQIPASASPGTIAVSSSVISGTMAGSSVTNIAASDTLIISGLTFLKSFIDDPVLPGFPVSLQYTIANAATASAATGITFTDSLGAALYSLQIQGSPPTRPCGEGSSITGTTALIFTGGELLPGDSCTFTVPLEVPGGAAAGSYTSSTSILSATVDSINTSTPAASDTLVVEKLTVNLSTTASDPTENSPIPVNISFSRPVVNFVMGDLVVTNGSAGNFTGSGSLYTVEITPIADGIVSIDVPANVADDAFDTSIKNPAAQQLSLAYSTSVVLPPSLSISAPSISSTNTGPVSFTVTYTNADTVNLSSAAIVLNKAGTANAEVTVINGNTLSPTVTLSSITGDGTLGMTINAETARNNGIKLAPAAGPSATFSVDNTKPGVSISDIVTNPYNHTFTATFIFDEAVTDFTVDEIIVSNATLSNFTASSATVYTVLVTPSSQGEITLDVAADSAFDRVNNGNTAASRHSVTFDRVKPSVEITSPSPDVNTHFTATIAFSEAVNGFFLSDITAENAELSNFLKANDKVYFVKVTPFSDGAVTLDISAAVATDDAGNTNTAATQLSVNYCTTLPSVTISGPAGRVSGNLIATFTFSKPVSGFIEADITVSNGGLSNFTTDSAMVYTVLVTPTDDGLVTIDVDANVATDNFGNGNSAASQYLVTAERFKWMLFFPAILTQKKETIGSLRQY